MNITTAIEKIFTESIACFVEDMKSNPYNLLYTITGKVIHSTKRSKVYAQNC